MKKGKPRKKQVICKKLRSSRRDFLKFVGLGMVTVAVQGCKSTSAIFSDKMSKNRPNIIFILADDLGYAELGCCGNTFNETPNLDELADRGIKFTNAYASAPVCSPYRAALMTGQYPARVGITDYLRPNDANHLSTDHITIAEMLKRAGYATGIIGKWHLTGYANHGAEQVPPTEHGFDEVIVSENRGIGGGSYFHPYHFNREIEKRLPGKEYLVDRCNLEAVEFIERHKDGPFFLYLSHYAVHTRLQGKDELVAKYEKKPGAGRGNKASRNNPHLAAQLESIDEGVGMIMNKLDELGLTENTVLIFTGDNGGEDRVTTNAPLRAGKSTLYEGGIREPLIIRWPPVVKPGSICNTQTSNIDFYPTFLQLAGLRPAPRWHLDGVSILPLLKNPQAKLARSTLYWHYPLKNPHFLGGRSAGAIRQGDFKLIEFFDNGEVELYNLAEDIAEKNNLAEKLPEKVKELQKRLTAWRTDVGAKAAGRMGKVN
jgi:arylsulfatase A